MTPIPGMRIGHVHLKVADLQRAIDFYMDMYTRALDLDALLA